MLWPLFFFFYVMNTTHHHTLIQSPTVLKGLLNSQHHLSGGFIGTQTPTLQVFHILNFPGQYICPSNISLWAEWDKQSLTSSIKFSMILLCFKFCTYSYGKLETQINYFPGYPIHSDVENLLKVIETPFLR